jgi:hypothetical protein
MKIMKLSKKKKNDDQKTRESITIRKQIDLDVERHE